MIISSLSPSFSGIELFSKTGGKVLKITSGLKDYKL